MLTLFPRIRANPPAPPPPEAPEAKEVAGAQGGGEAAAVEPAVIAEAGDSVLVAPAAAEASDASVASAADEAVSVSFDADLIASPCEPFADSALADPAVEQIAEGSESGASGVETLDDSASDVLELKLPSPEDPDFLSTAEFSEPATTVDEVSAAESPANDASPSETGDSERSDANAAADSYPMQDMEAPELSFAAANIFDELDILHEAGAELASEPVTEATPEALPRVTLEEVLQATREANRDWGNEEQEAVAEAPLTEEPREVAPIESATAEVATDALADSATESASAEAASTEPALAEMAAADFDAVAPTESAADVVPLSEMVALEASLQEPASREAAEQEAPTDETPTLDAVAQEVANQEAPALEVPAQQVFAERTPPETITVEEPITAESAAETSEAPTAVDNTVTSASIEAASVLPNEAATADGPIDAALGDSASAASPAPVARTAPIAPAKAKRPKGIGFFELVRVPEPEAMEDSGEVEAYASAAAQAHLDAIDDTFVAHAQLLLKGRERGRALDIGTGPGQIVMKLGARLTRWKFVGVDRSAAMIEKARENLAGAAELAGRVEFRVADGNSLDFPDGTFDLVFCNSVLHHLAEPQNLFSEMARLVKPGGAILLRDLRRPSRFGFGFHVRKHGKHYGGEMRRLYVASVHAAYTEEELQKMVAASALRDVCVFRHGKTHIGFDRAIGNPSR